MKKRSYGILLGMVVSVNAEAVDIGIGLSARSNDVTIYLPVNIAPSYRIEASVLHSDLEDERSGTMQQTNNMELGLGAFRLSKNFQPSQLYYGIRVIYIKRESKFISSSPSVSSSINEYDGYGISPALGFEYFIADYLSIGGEIAWRYGTLEGDVVNSGTKSTIELKDSGTDSKLLVRYYF